MSDLMKQPPPGEEDSNEIDQVRIACYRQQSDYYRAKAELLAQKKLDKSKKRIGWMEGVAMAGQVIAILSVLLGFYTTRSSIRELQRTREDTSFFEALKRAGDKDSPATRANAAELLATKAEMPEYYPAVRSQLLHSLLIEEHPVVLGAIQDATLRLMDGHPEAIRERLKIVDEKLRGQVRESLARVTLDQRGEVPREIGAQQWSEIEALSPQTNLKQGDFEQIISEREKEFLAHQITCRKMLQPMTDEERHIAAEQFRREFQAAVLRLYLTRSLLARG